MSTKLFYGFYQRIVVLEYHVHCDPNERIRKLFINLELRFKVTIADWCPKCFSLPTDTDTNISRTLGPHGLWFSEIQTISVCTNRGTCFAIWSELSNVRHVELVRLNGIFDCYMLTRGARLAISRERRVGPFGWPNVLLYTNCFI